MKKLLLVVTLILFSPACTAVGRDDQAAGILLKLEHSVDGLKDYTVSIQAGISMERLRVPKMTARLYFKQPDKVHFEAEGFAMFPRQGIGFNPAALRKNYSGVVTGADTIGGIPAVKVGLIPKSDSSGVRNLTIWVDTQRWVVVKAESVPYPGRTMTMLIEYGKAEDKWWLPSTMTMNLEGGQEPDQGVPQRGRQQLPRKGTITVVYSDYKINQNLPDEIFNREEAVQKPGEEHR